MCAEGHRAQAHQCPILEYLSVIPGDRKNAVIQVIVQELEDGGRQVKATGGTSGAHVTDGDDAGPPVRRISDLELLAAM
jgi:hypothetical protein